MKKIPWYKLFLWRHLWNLIISQFISISYFYFTALNLAFSFCFFLAETTRNWKKKKNLSIIKSNPIWLFCSLFVTNRPSHALIPPQTFVPLHALCRGRLTVEHERLHGKLRKNNEVLVTLTWALVLPDRPACSPPSILLVLTRSMFQPGGGWVGPSRCRALNFSIIF